MTSREIDRDHDGTRDAFYIYRGGLARRGEARRQQRRHLRPRGELREPRAHARRSRTATTTAASTPGPTTRAAATEVVVAHREGHRRRRPGRRVRDVRTRYGGKPVLAKREEDKNGDGTDRHHVDLRERQARAPRDHRSGAGPALVARLARALALAAGLLAPPSISSSLRCRSRKRWMRSRSTQQHELLVALAHPLELERELALGQARGLEVELEIDAPARCRRDASAVTRTWLRPSRTGHEAREAAVRREAHVVRDLRGGEVREHHVVDVRERHALEERRRCRPGSARAGTSPSVMRAISVAANGFVSALGPSA